MASNISNHHKDDAMLKLHYTKRSPYARKVRVVAMEKGIELTLIEQDLQNKSAELLRLNPLGKIPLLEPEAGPVLTDSTLICEYLDALKPEPALWPADPDARLVLMNLDAVAKGLMDVTVSIFYERALHPDAASEPFLVKQGATVGRCLTYFENSLTHLNVFNMAAIGVACAIGYIRLRVPELWDGATVPGLKAWFQDISRRESFQKTVPAV